MSTLDMNNENVRDLDNFIFDGLDFIDSIGNDTMHFDLIKEEYIEETTKTSILHGDIIETTPKERKIKKSR